MKRLMRKRRSAQKKSARPSLIKRGTITEVQRTVLLLILLAIAVGILFYVQTNVENNFVDQL